LSQFFYVMHYDFSQHSLELLLRLFHRTLVADHAFGKSFIQQVSFPRGSDGSWSYELSAAKKKAGVEEKRCRVRIGGVGRELMFLHQKRLPKN
jgi:hypothetical protein